MSIPKLYAHILAAGSVIRGDKLVYFLPKLWLEFQLLPYLEIESARLVQQLLFQQLLHEVPSGGKYQLTLAPAPCGQQIASVLGTLKASIHKEPCHFLALGFYLNPVQFPRHL